MTYNTQYLKVLGLADTTERYIKSTDKVDTLCVKCEAVFGSAQFSNLVSRVKRFGAGWHCPVCQKAVMASKAKVRMSLNNHMKGKKHTEETKAKIKATRPGLKTRGPVTDSEKIKLSAWMKSDEFVATKVQPRGRPEVEAKIKTTMLERYGVEHYSKTEAFRDWLSNNHHNRKVFLYRLDDTPLVDICRWHGKNFSNAVRVFKQYGEMALRAYLISEVHKSSLEVLGESLFGTPFFNKKVIAGYRPDFAINEKLYVNLDGLYYHSQKEELYHFDMRLRYEEAGLRIFQFREDEVVHKGHIIRSILDSALGRNTKIMARKCEIRKLSTKESSQFFRDNHLMGDYSATKGFGLFFRDELVCAISIRLHKTKPMIEIARFANKCSVNVTGGFSKLLSHIEKLYQPKIIGSFCDLRYATGRVYEKTGFNLTGVHLGWQWTDGKHTFNRLYCRAKMDERNLSMDEYAAEMGLMQIFDAGQAKYIKIL